MNSELYSKIQSDIAGYEESNPQTTNFYREYTESLTNRLNIYVFNAQGEKTKIPVMYANPERAIAKVKEDRNLQLPLISLAIGDIEETIKNRKPNLQLSHYKFFDVEKQRAFRIVKRASKAVSLQFHVTFWSKYTEDMNQMVEEMQMLFQPELALPVLHEQENKAFLVDILDMSSIQAGDKQDRLIRKRATIKVEAYIPGRQYLYSNTGRIKEVINHEFVAK